MAGQKRGLRLAFFMPAATIVAACRQLADGASGKFLPKLLYVANGLGIYWNHHRRNLRTRWRRTKKTPIKGDKIGVTKSLISEGFPLREEKREAISSPAI
jgi:hypothetical protein